jgi:hypothetical protein
MARKEFIGESEDKVLKFQALVREVEEAAEIEANASGGRLLPENRDQWNTLVVNMQDAERKLSRACDKLLSLL